jgi:hypothetical protein
MFRIYADIQTDFGKALIDIIKKSFPGQEVSTPAGTVGHKLMAIARGQLQNNDAAAMDAIQDLLTYLSIGSQYETVDGKIQMDENGQKIRRKDPKTWDFAKDFKTPDEALTAVYRNLKTTAINNSKKKTKLDKAERSIDQAYGTRDEGGGAPSDGEGKMPTPDENSLSKALDDRASLVEFFNVLDDIIPDLRETLSPEEDALFGLIYDDEVGTFGSDIKDNMGQATEFQKKLEAGGPDLKAIYEKNAKRWSGFVGDTRKKLLSKIQDFVENDLNQKQVDALHDMFFSDTTQKDVRKLEKEKEGSKADYQKGIDLRKLLKFRDSKEPSDKEKASAKTLEEKLVKQLGGQDELEKALEAESKAGKKKPAKEAPSAMDAVAAAVAGLSGPLSMDSIARSLAGF